MPRIFFPDVHNSLFLLITSPVSRNRTQRMYQRHIKSFYMSAKKIDTEKIGVSISFLLNAEAL